MELKEFVKEALVQISQGVKDAHAPVKEVGGIVNPATRTKTDASGAYFATVDDCHHVFLVDFDVAVTVSETTGTDAHAKLTVATFASLGVGGKSGNSTEATNRLTFKVPLAMPVDTETREKILKAIADQDAKVKNHNSGRTSGY